MYVYEKSHWSYDSDDEIDAKSENPNIFKARPTEAVNYHKGVYLYIRVMSEHLKT